MGFQPVILWTDALIYVLLALSAIGVWYTSRHQHLSQPWRRVARSRTGQAAMVVLLCYAIIGLLDTLHFNPETGKDEHGRAIYSTEVLSLFDQLAGSLRTQREKTYSAPFAIHLFSKETIEQADGTTRRDYPRLTYGGAHLGEDGA